jgi:methyl-accepting chemotaxis protein
MIAYARSSSGRDDYALAERDAALAVARLATAGASDFPRLVRGPVGDLALDRVSAFRLEPGRPAQPRGNALPGWASPERLVAVADGDAALPDHRLALRVARSEQGVVVGALVRMDERDIDRFPMALAVLLVVSLWAPICAWNLSRSVSVPLGSATEVMRRAVEVGDLSQMGTLPITTRTRSVGHAVPEPCHRQHARARAAAGRVGAGDARRRDRGHGELPEAFRQMLVRLRAVVQEVHSTSSELAAAATEILAASQEQEAASTSHSAGMTEIPHTMESLSESSGGVAAAPTASWRTPTDPANTDHMVSRINELTGHANRIGDNLDIIRDISDRADLLALNGSLEATRAGEAGLGSPSWPPRCSFG